jgi:hypothetical protein
MEPAVHMTGSFILVPDHNSMQRAARLSNNQTASSINFSSQLPLAQRIGPRGELPATPATSRRVVGTVPRPKPQKKPQATVKLPTYSYDTLCPIRQVSYIRLAQSSPALMNMTASPYVVFI